MTTNIDSVFGSEAGNRVVKIPVYYVKLLRKSLFWNTLNVTNLGFNDIVEFLVGLLL